MSPHACLKGPSTPPRNDHPQPAGGSVPLETACALPRSGRLPRPGVHLPLPSARLPHPAAPAPRTTAHPPRLSTLLPRTTAHARRGGSRLPRMSAGYRAPQSPNRRSCIVNPCLLIRALGLPGVVFSGYKSLPNPACGSKEGPIPSSRSGGVGGGTASTPGYVVSPLRGARPPSRALCCLTWGHACVMPPEPPTPNGRGGPDARPGSIPW